MMAIRPHHPKTEWICYHVEGLVSLILDARLLLCFEFAVGHLSLGLELEWYGSLMGDCASVYLR